jgi:RluA family pseudouridine synthase
LKHLTVRRAQDLKSFLAQALGISRNQAKTLIDSRTVLVDSRRTWIATHQLRRGDTVEVAAPRAVRPATDTALKIVYQDREIIAVNKPPSIVSDSGPTSAETLIRQQLENNDLRAVHRLDRETSGVLIFARTPVAFERYKDLWTARQVLKTYLALCAGQARFEQTSVNLPIEGRTASSRIELVKTFGRYSLVRAHTRTGRRHQVRIHLNQLRLPVIGDKTYASPVLKDPLLKTVTRQMLHCQRIQFGPADAPALTITAPLPTDFVRTARRLGLLK